MSRVKVIRFFHAMSNVEDETIAATCELTGVHNGHDGARIDAVSAFGAGAGGGADRRDRRRSPFHLSNRASWFIVEGDGEA